MSRARWIVLAMAAAAAWGCGGNDSADVTEPVAPPPAPPPPPPPSDNAISAVSPASAVAGASDLTITIRGAYFVGGPTGSQAAWVANSDTTLLATRFVSSTELTAVVPAALLSNPLTAQVFVLIGDPLEAGRTSKTNALAFDIEARPPAARLRVVHAEPRAGLMDVVIDGKKWVSNLPYLTNTGYIELPSGPHDIGIDIASGRMVEFHPSLAAGTDYTVLPCCALMGNGLLLRDDNSAPPDGRARLRFVDYASFASSVRAYVTAPGAHLATATPIDVEITWASDYMELPAGKYRIRITPFDRDTVTIDSGTLTLASGAVRTAVAVDRPGGGPPYDLLMLEDRTPPETTGTLVVYAPTIPGRRPFTRGRRQVALDGGPWRVLVEGGRLTFDRLSPGAHRLRLSNPCTGNHEPSVQPVTAVAGDTVTVAVRVPPPCE